MSMPMTCIPGYTNSKPGIQVGTKAVDAIQNHRLHSPEADFPVSEQRKIDFLL